MFNPYILTQAIRPVAMRAVRLRALVKMAHARVT